MTSSGCKIIFEFLDLLTNSQQSLWWDHNLIFLFCHILILVNLVYLLVAGQRKNMHLIANNLHVWRWQSSKRDCCIFKFYITKLHLITWCSYSCTSYLLLYVYGAIFLSSFLWFLNVLSNLFVCVRIVIGLLVIELLGFYPIDPYPSLLLYICIVCLSFIINQFPL